MIGRIDGRQTLAVEVFFAQAGVVHGKSRGPSEILCGGLARFSGFATETIGWSLADADNCGFSSNTHE
jgi:hypothetical protein